jgi:hypothetical protein
MLEIMADCRSWLRWCGLYDWNSVYHPSMNALILAGAATAAEYLHISAGTPVVATILA